MKLKVNMFITVLFNKESSYYDPLLGDGVIMYLEDNQDVTNKLELIGDPDFEVRESTNSEKEVCFQAYDKLGTKHININAVKEREHIQKLIDSVKN